MRRRGNARLATGLIAVAALTPWPAPAQAHSIAHQQSANWAGYADTAHVPLSGASAQWVEPRATCDQPHPTYSAFWVGLGGFKRTSHAIEQIGSEADCTPSGRSTTYAWYELVPAPSVRLKLAVRPGNVLKARVVVRGEWATLKLANLSTGHSFTKSIRIASPDESSAEWIAEAPSACVSANQCQPLPLSDFGTVSFAQARASTDHGHTGTITDLSFSTTEMTLSPGGLVIGPAFAAAASSGEATPSAIAAGGDAFTVTYRPTTSPVPPPPVASADQVRHGITAP